MSDQFLGEIRMFGGTFAPAGWALCDGQLLSVAQNNALFSLFGTLYGGDGRTTFGLPELRGRVPIHYGSGPGLTNRPLGQRAGSETAAVANANEVPSHTHTLRASDGTAGRSNPQDNVLAVSSNIDLYSGDPPDVDLAAQAILAAGGSGAAHENLQPFQAVNFIVALAGVYPSRR
ncbi:MAG: phage tail protein [Dehalococcoidia bacterium]